MGFANVFKKKEMFSTCLLKLKDAHNVLWWVTLNTTALRHSEWLADNVACSGKARLGQTFMRARLCVGSGWYLTLKVIPLLNVCVRLRLTAEDESKVLEKMSVWKAYLVSAYWPELASVLLTCRGIATWCPVTWSFLLVNGTDSTPPAPVVMNRAEGLKHVNIWLTAGILSCYLNLRLTKRLSNFLASVMWIQLSFSMTLMCFTSSLNL